MKKGFSKGISVMCAAAVMAGGAAFPASAAGRDIFVDPVLGSDAGSGSASEPYATVAAAVSAAEGSGATIRLADGEYFFDAPLSLGPACSGLTFVAEGENAVFTGAVKLDSWQETEFGGRSCLRADVGTGYGQVMLYSDVPLVNSRMPDTGFFYLRDGADPESDQQTFAHNRAVIADPADVSALAGADLSGAFFRLYHYWTEELLKVSSCGADGKIVFDRSYGESVSLNTANKNDAFCFENVAAGFTSPGEWYMDYASGSLYYIPKPGETADSLSLRLGVTERLIEIDGADSVAFEGVTFANTGWKYASNYMQSAYGSKSAVTVKNSSGVSFTACKFVNIGASALNVGDWTVGRVSSCSVRSCLFENIGASAVIVGGPNSDDCPDGVTVTDCLVSGYGLTRRQAAGIFVTHAKNVSVTHNEIHGGSYTAVSCGWRWGFDYTHNENNDLSYNLIYDIGHDALSDMGGIYVLGAQPGSVMRGNVVHDVAAGPDATTYGGWGLYTDEGSSGWTITCNTVYDCGSQGFHQHYGFRNLVENNIFAFNEDGQVRSSASDRPAPEGFTGEYDHPDRMSVLASDGTQFTLRRNILVADDGLMYHNLNRSYFTDEDNLYWDYSRFDRVRSLSGSVSLTREAVRIGCGTNAYNGGVFRDPLFLDPANRNFSLLPYSETEKIIPDYREILECASMVGSETFGSGYLVNLLPLARSECPEELWQAYESAVAAAVDSRTEENIAALADAVAAIEGESVPARHKKSATLMSFLRQLLTFIRALLGIPACGC